MLKTTLKITALSAVSLTLIACGGSGGGDNNPALNPPASPAAAVADRVVSFRGVGPYSNGGTAYSNDLSQAAAEIVQLDNSQNITYTETQDTFALAQSGANLVMTVNGTAYTFTPAIGTPAIAATPGNAGSPATYEWAAVGDGYLFGSSNDTRTVLNGTHPTVQGGWVGYGTFPEGSLQDISIRDFNLDATSGYATIGIQTLPSVVASQTATATYTGNGSLNQTQGTQVKLAGVALPFIGEGGLYMRINFNVDFGANTVSGTGTDVSTNFSAQPNQDGSYPETINGIVTFGVAPIVDNGFAGTFTIDSGGQNRFGISGNPTGNYAGNFFGPDADDIAGVMRIQGTNALGTVYGGGGFRADRQEPAQ